MPRRVHFRSGRALFDYYVRHLNHSLYAGFDDSLTIFEVFGQPYNKQRTFGLRYCANIGPRYPDVTSCLGVDDLNLGPGTASEQPFIRLCVLDGWIEGKRTASYIVERRRN